MFSKLSYIFVPSLFVVSGLLMVLHPMYQKQQSLSQLRYATANVRTFSDELQTTVQLPAPVLTPQTEPVSEKNVIVAMPVVQKTAQKVVKEVKNDEKKSKRPIRVQ